MTGVDRAQRGESSAARPPSALALRASGAADLDAVLAMETDPDTRPWLGETGPGWHAAAMADPGVEHLTGLRVGRPVGFVVLAEPRGPETGTELRRIVVGADHRGAGLGRALLRAALDHVGPGRVWLDVKPGNARALALYRASGFVVERERPMMILAREG